MNNKKQYYIFKDSKSLGPYSESQIFQLLLNNEITKETLAWNCRDKSSTFKKLSEHFELENKQQQPKIQDETDHLNIENVDNLNEKSKNNDLSDEVKLDNSENTGVDLPQSKVLQLIRKLLVWTITALIVAIMASLIFAVVFYLYIYFAVFILGYDKNDHFLIKHQVKAIMLYIVSFLYIASKPTYNFINRISYKIFRKHQ